MRLRTPAPEVTRNPAGRGLDPSYSWFGNTTHSRKCKEDSELHAIECTVPAPSVRPTGACCHVDRNKGYVQGQQQAHRSQPEDAAVSQRSESGVVSASCRLYGLRGQRLPRGHGRLLTHSRKPQPPTPSSMSMSREHGGTSGAAAFAGLVYIGRSDQGTLRFASGMSTQALHMHPQTGAPHELHRAHRTGVRSRTVT